MRKINKASFFLIYARNSLNQYHRIACVYAIRPAVTSAQTIAKFHFGQITAVAIIEFASWEEAIRAESSLSDLSGLNVVIQKEF